MKTLTLLFLVSSFSLYAAEDCPTAPLPGAPDNLDQIAVKALPTCTPEDSDAYREFLKYFPANSKKESAKILGTALKGNPELLKILKEMVSSPDYDAWALKAKDCKEVLCVAEKIFGGKKAAYQAFNIAKRNGYTLKVGSLFGDQAKAQVLRPKEMDLIDEAFKMLPPELNHLKKLDGYYRLPDGAATNGTEGAAAWAQAGSLMSPGKIVFQDGTFHYDSSWTRQVVIHETCHHYDYQTLYSNPLGGKRRIDQPSFGFNELSGWKKVTKNGTLGWEHNAQAKFITSYASTQPGEDFAETCAYYVENPEALKTKAPEKYTFMKNKVFGGKEFSGYKAPTGFPTPTLDICSAYISSCLKFIDLSSGSFGMKIKEDGDDVFTSSSKSMNWVANEKCYQDARALQIKQMVYTLAQNKEVYCRLGGEGPVKAKLEKKFCEKNFNDTMTVMSRVGEVEGYLKDAKKSCKKVKKDERPACMAKYFEEQTPLKLSSLNPQAKEAFYKKLLDLD